MEGEDDYAEKEVQLVEEAYVYNYDYKEVSK